MEASPSFSDYVSRRSKYSTQHPVLKPGLMYILPIVSEIKSTLMLNIMYKVLCDRSIYHWYSSSMIPWGVSMGEWAETDRGVV
jgi:hypothetical protein